MSRKLYYILACAFVFVVMVIILRQTVFREGGGETNAPPAVTNAVGGGMAGLSRHPITGARLLRRAAQPRREPPLVEPEKLTEEILEKDVVRSGRHHAVKRYLNSPARFTPECEEIARICRRFDLGPWAIPAAYNLAWEATYFPLPPELPPEFTRGLDMAQAKLGVTFDPTFLETVMAIRPTVFFGQGFQFQPKLGEPMLDTMSWEEVQDH